MRLLARIAVLLFSFIEVSLAHLDANARPPLPNSTAAAVQIANPPPIFFAGQMIFPSLLVDVRDVDNANANTAAFFKMVSTAGANNSGKLYSAFAAAILAHVVVKSGGSGGVGFNDNCDLDGHLMNSRMVGCTAGEFDVNNGDADRVGPVFGSGNFTVGVLANGGGQHTNNAALEVANGNTRIAPGLPPPFVLWDAGLRIEQFEPQNGFIGYNYGIQDLSNSKVAFDIQGKHNFGLNLASARFVDGSGDPTHAYSINAPGFRIDGTGHAFATRVDVERLASSTYFALPVTTKRLLNKQCLGAEGSMIVATGFVYVCDPATGTYGEVAISHQDN